MNYPFNTVKKENCAIVKNASDTLYICLKKRGTMRWELLSEISSSNWYKNRDTISYNMSRLLKKGEVKQDVAVNKTKDLFYKIYKNLSIADKKLFLKENKTSWVAKESCSVCLNKATKKHKCIHNDCLGMCDECSKNMLDDVGKCKSCLKSQLIECPICYDENPVDKMCKSKTCTHYVCWSCYGKAHHCGHPIESCPSCRADFIEMDDYDSFSDSDMELDDAWGDIDAETIREIEQNLMDNDPNSTSEDVITAINMLINTPVENYISLSNESFRV